MTHSGQPGFEPELSSRFRFPDPEVADEEGLVAVGGDLSPGTILAACRSGIFPWSDEPVITWWSPDPRAIIPLDGLHVSRSLARLMRRRTFRVTFDRAFRAVMEGCAESRPGREETWISPAFIRSYTRLHELGWAHCAECWLGERLVGGIYGVAIGAWFGGESMFSAEPNASKVALAALVERLAGRGFQLFDAQVMSPHLASLGAIDIPRSEYLARLSKAIAEPVEFGGG